jgi:hypothetical protein
LMIRDTLPGYSTYSIPIAKLFSRGPARSEGEGQKAIVLEVAATAKEIGRSSAQVALAWMRHRATPVIPIVGAPACSKRGRRLCTEPRSGDGDGFVHVRYYRSWLEPKWSERMKAVRGEPIVYWQRAHRSCERRRSSRQGSGRVRKQHFR